MNRQSAVALLVDLKEEIISSDITPELKAHAKHLVFGSGSPDADIVFIGEAPGKKEDETGEPFVGAAGKFLNEMLAVSGLKREDVYITNIVKYRPPDNRDPLPEEKRAFWPYLVRQIKIIKPKVIVTLGRHSGMCFLSDLQISRDHGCVQGVKFGGYECLIMPLYHPAAVLYKGSLRQILIDDFKKATLVVRQSIEHE